MGSILRTRSWEMADFLHMLSNMRTNEGCLREKENAAKWSEWFSSKLKRQLKIQTIIQISLLNLPMMKTKRRNSNKLTVVFLKNYSKLCRWVNLPSEIWLTFPMKTNCVPFVNVSTKWATNTWYCPVCTDSTKNASKRGSQRKMSVRSANSPFWKKNRMSIK